MVSVSATSGRENRNPCLGWKGPSPRRETGNRRALRSDEGHQIHHGQRIRVGGAAIGNRELRAEGVEEYGLNNIVLVGVYHC